MTEIVDNTFLLVDVEARIITSGLSVCVEVDLLGAALQHVLPCDDTSSKNL